MNDFQDQPAEEVQHQASLFDDPISRLLEAEDALKEDDKRVKEYETDFPIDLEALIASLKDIQAQVKERKEAFLQDIKENNADYGEALAQRAETQIKYDNLKSDVKQLALKEATKGKLELTLEINGTIVNLASLDETTVYINGKAL